MGRKPRVEYFGAIYHIINSGKNLVFINSEDKIKFLSILGEIRDISDFYLIAYCIMDNHYHLIIKTHNIPISKIMHRINARYAKYFNAKYNRKGSPYTGRYRGIIVDNGYNLLNIIRFIHNNPVYLKKAEFMDEYKWNSDFFYRMNVDSLVDINYILDLLSTNREVAIDFYKNFMSKLPKDYYMLKEKYEYRDFICEDNNVYINRRKEELDKILKDICPSHMDYELIKKGSRKSYIMKYKYEYIMKCKSLGYVNSEIAESLGITERAIRKGIQALVPCPKL